MVLLRAKKESSQLLRYACSLKNLPIPPGVVEEVLSDTMYIDIAAQTCKDVNDALFIGRGMEPHLLRRRPQTQEKLAIFMLRHMLQER